MKRRDFLTLAGASTTYGILINPNGWGAEAKGPREVIGERFEELTKAPPVKEGFTGEAHMRLSELECDLFIAGGGMSGVCAAVAAAREGAKVILVQDRSRLGGNSSSEVKMHIVGADIHGQRPGWREGGLIEEFRLDDAVANPHRSREMWDLLLYDKMVSEPNIRLFLDTVCFKTETKNNKIEAVYARSDKTEQIFKIRAKIYADCTGDSRLALEAGAEIKRGRETKSEFNEKLALDKPDDHTLGSSILFTSRDFGKPIPFTPPKWARKITKDMLRLRPIQTWEYGYWWVEWGGAIDTILDNERIRFELLGITLGVWDYIKNSGNFPSSANWALDWLGMVPGKRGSRRIMGDHVLKQQDLMGETEPFYDGVCIGGWSMDDHPPGGFDRPDLKPCVQIPPPFPYNIPLRSLYSRNIENLMMAGRNISATHVAFTSTRVMATCSVIGQAMGTAAAFALKQNLAPRQLANDKEKVAALQQLLLKRDQTIRGTKNTDPSDLAPKAEITASDALEEADPTHVINGFVRDLPGKWENRWGAYMVKEGVWLQLEWKKPQSIRDVHITFDSGFHRELTLSHQDSANARMIRAAQPETIRDYEILCKKGNDWVSLVKISNNHQRLRRHQFEPVTTTALRLKVTSTNGSDTARVYEVRCYS